jgi:23S rRNA pseudouridine1911/1915/1917 synthase
MALIPGQALHAAELAFTHPETGKDMTFKADPPEGMQKLLDKWRNFSRYRHDD